MKNLFIFFALLPLTIFAKGPQIKFLENTHEFGNVPEKGGKVTAVFRFVNTGDAPLMILSATASCGCTNPSFEDAPVEPGDTARLSVTYNPDGRPGEFSKTIVVRSNSEKNSSTRLKIKGCVLPKP